MGGKQKKILSEDEVQKLRRQIEIMEDRPEFWKAMFDTTLKHGLRAGEVVSLKWKHIDLDNEELHVEDAKNHKNRTVAIPSGFCPNLARLGRGKKEEDWLFPSPQSGHYGKRRFQQKMRDEWSMEAGFYPDHVHSGNIEEEIPEVHRITPHTLRHTFATQHLKNGTPIERVSDMLGHQDVSTTYEEYSHLVTEDHREYQNKIEL